MLMDDYLSEDEWKNITPYLNAGMANAKDGIDWFVHLSLYSDTEDKKMLFGQTVAELSADGLILNPAYRFLLKSRSVNCKDSAMSIGKKSFMIFAKKRKRE